MIMLSNNEIRELIKSAGLIENYVDWHTQLQPCGFDLTLDYIEVPIDNTTQDESKMTVIDFTNEKRRLAQMRRILPTQDRFGDEWFVLNPGNYVFHTNEKINCPTDISGFMLIRSSLQRAAIIGLATAIIDPGFYGHLTLALSIPAPGLIIKRRGRFAQLIFFKLLSPSSKNYSGAYQEKKEVKDNGIP